jgi:hypothetical protein
MSGVLKWAAKSFARADTIKRYPITKCILIINEVNQRQILFVLRLELIIVLRFYLSCASS